MLATDRLTISIHNLAYLTFGRNNAQYWRLVDSLALVSTVLWILVILTTLGRWAAHAHKRHLQRFAKVEERT